MTYAAAAIAAIAILVLIACNRKKPETIEETTVEKIEESKPVQENAVEPVVETPKADPIVALLLSIKKTPCFGKCPVYEITLYSDGKVNYNGKKFVEKLGLHEASMTAQEALGLVAEITKMGFFDMAKEYPQNGRKITDLPSTITFVNNLEKSWTINNNHQAPRELNRIEKMILERLEGLEFKQVSGGNAK